MQRSSRSNLLLDGGVSRQRRLRMGRGGRGLMRVAVGGGGGCRQVKKSREGNQVNMVNIQRKRWSTRRAPMEQRGWKFIEEKNTREYLLKKMIYRYIYTVLEIYNFFQSGD
jgi:hypothetical protein